MGIVGLPNVGKSTLFNVLTKMGIPAENFPFCTIEPNQVSTTSAQPVPPRQRWQQQRQQRQLQQQLQQQQKERHAVVDFTSGEGRPVEGLLCMLVALLPPGCPAASGALAMV